MNTKCECCAPIKWNFIIIELTISTAIEIWNENYTISSLRVLYFDVLKIYFKVALKGKNRSHLTCYATKPPNAALEWAWCQERTKIWEENRIN